MRNTFGNGISILNLLTNEFNAYCPLEKEIFKLNS